MARSSSTRSHDAAASGTHQSWAVWLYSTAVTLLLFVIPLGVGSAALSIGLPGPEGIMASVVVLAASLAYLSAVRRMTARIYPDYSGDIMLWSLMRRRVAEAKIQEVSAGLVAAGSIAEIDEIPVGPLRELARALDRKDRYTSGHSKRVEAQASRLALELDLENDELDDLTLAAALHDVGKIQVPDAILNKPDILTDDEFAVVQKHPVVGARMIGPSVNIRVMDAVLHHHERWDGEGYPDGVAGTDIPLLSRVIAIVDAYDAMTSARPYRPAMSHRVAVDTVKQNAGTQFDPDVVELFVDAFERQSWTVGSWTFLAPLELLRRVGARWRDVVATQGSATVGATATAAIVAVGSIVMPGSPQRPPVAVASESDPVQLDRSDGSLRSDVKSLQIKKDAARSMSADASEPSARGTVTVAASAHAGEKTGDHPSSSSEDSRKGKNEPPGQDSAGGAGQPSTPPSPVGSKEPIEPGDDDGDDDSDDTSDSEDSDDSDDREGRRKHPNASHHSHSGKD